METENALCSYAPDGSIIARGPKLFMVLIAPLPDYTFSCFVSAFETLWVVNNLPNETQETTQQTNLQSNVCFIQMFSYSFIEMSTFILVVFPLQQQ